jgi:hypothetical protein
MSNILARTLLAFALLVASAAHGAEIAPLPQILPDEVEQLTIAQLDSRSAAGDLKAQAELGARYARGAGVTADPKKALSLFEAAAKKNEANAQYYLATAYYTGFGMKQDPKLAARWFGRAAAQGHAGAQYSLGVMMATGEGGLKADPKKAAIHVAKSAEQGFIQAAFRMAQLHIAGLGVERDHERAADWYRRILKTQKDYNPAIAGLVVLIETRGAEWQPGDPGSAPPPLPKEAADTPGKEFTGSATTAATGPLITDAPDSSLRDLPPEKEVTTTFKTVEGPVIDVRTRAGALTFFSTSDKPYHCQIDAKFTYLDAAGVRQQGNFACFKRPRPAGQRVEVCDVVHRNFVQTKVDEIALSSCDPPAPQ